MLAEKKPNVEAARPVSIDVDVTGVIAYLPAESSERYQLIEVALDE